MSYCCNPCAPACAPANVCCRSVCIKTRDKCGKKHKEYIQVCDGATGPTGPTGAGGVGVGVSTQQTTGQTGAVTTPVVVAFGTTAVGAGNFPSANFVSPTYTVPTTGLYNVGVGTSLTLNTSVVTDTLTTNLLVGATVIRSETSTTAVASATVASQTFSHTIAADLYLLAGQTITVNTVGTGATIAYTINAGTGTYLNIALIAAGVPT